jgi:hypothetical protein
MGKFYSSSGGGARNTAVRYHLQANSEVTPPPPFHDRGGEAIWPGLKKYERKSDLHFRSGTNLALLSSNLLLRLHLFHS